MKLSLIVSMLCITSIAIASPPHGSLVATRLLDPKHGAVYQVELKGGEKTTIDAHGDHMGGNLDCTLYLSANVITQDVDQGDACHMEVTPATTTTYAVVVLNNGTHPDNMILMVQ